MEKVTLPSGSILGLALAPFTEARALQQAIATELIGVKAMGAAAGEIDKNFIKDVLLTAISSDKIEAALKKCLARCTYNDSKINDDLFEPADARQDYLPVLQHVALANLEPFLKGLSTELSQALANLAPSRK